MRLITALLAAAALLQVAPAARILFLAPVSSKSHNNFYRGIIYSLADRGHQVTRVSPYKPSKERAGVTEVVLPDMDISTIVPNMFEGSHRLSAPLKLMNSVHTVCSGGLAKPEMQELLDQQFDLVLLTSFFSDCFLSVVHQLKVPHIYVSPAGQLPHMAVRLGDPSFPAIGSLFMKPKPPLSFVQRMASTLGETILMLFFHHYLEPRMEWECRRRGLCAPDMPSFAEFHRNTSLILLNSVRTTDTPLRSSVPSVIHCGGIHCHPAKPLPQNLDEFVRGAGEDGFIFFSLGSAITPSSITETHRKILVEVFGSLKQRVIWKWDRDTMDDLPPNVMLGKWLPQQDFLGDPRLRLFITHGGLHSTIESMYHGVPVLGMPVMGDQQANMLEVETDGWGRVLHWEELTHDRLRQLILTVMNDDSMRAEARRRSAVMQDQPQPPDEVCTYWVEYVLRHKGAAHLRSPAAGLPWYQLYNIDVWLTVTLLLLFVVYVLVRVTSAIFTRLCCPRKQKVD